MPRQRKVGAFIEAEVLSHWRAQVAGAAGFGVWAAAITWCDLHLTDGHIPAEAAYRLLPGARAAVPRVTKSGLWSVCVQHADCFELHRYSEDGRGRPRQPTRARLEEEREKQRERDDRKARSRTVPGGNDPGTRRERPGNEIGLDTPSSQVVPPPNPPQGEQPPTRKRRGTTLPASWKPADRHVALAETERLDLAVEVEKFRSHHGFKGTLGVDWDRGFDTWLRNAIRYRAEDAAKNPAAPTRKKFT